MDEPIQIPLRVTDIKVEGATNPEFVERQFSEVKERRTYEDVMETLTRTLQATRGLDGFESVICTLDRDPDAPISTASLQVKVQEKKNRRLFSLGATRDAQNGEGSTNFSAALRNTLGRGERLDLNTSFGESGSQEIRLGYHDPRFYLPEKLFPKTYHPYAQFYAGIHNQLYSHTWNSSYNLKSRGLTLSLSDPQRVHEVSYEGSWRDVIPAQRNWSWSQFERKVEDKREDVSPTLSGPSASVYDVAGPSVKSSLKYTYTHNRVQGAVMPQQGHAFTATTEFAGLGGDVQFVKQDNAFSYFIPINKKSQTSLGLSFKTGLVRSWSTWASLAPQHLLSLSPTLPIPRLPICDRYFLDLKGFEPSAVGPRDGDDAIGGDLFASLAFRLSFLLPFEAAHRHNIFGQIYGVSGNSLMLAETDSHNRNLSSVVKELINGSRASVGFGVILPFNEQMKIELTFSKPLRKVATDPIRRFSIGLNVGVGF